MNLIQTIVNSLKTVMKLWMINRSDFCDLQSSNWQNASMELNIQKY